MKQNILIIGSEGFIGSHLVTHFNKAHQVYGIDLLGSPTQVYRYWQNSRSNNILETCFKETQFNVCINAAGSGNAGYSMQHPLSDFELNVLQTQHVLDIIRGFQPDCKYLHFSSAAVYGNPRHLPVQETDMIDPLSPYGWHKYMAENLCTEYNKIYSVPTAILRPFSVYGPGLKKQLFWDLYQKIKGNESRIELWGTGKETRDFIYIKDLCYCIDLIMQKSEFASTVYNIGVGEETTILRAATALGALLNPGIKIEFNKQAKPGDPQNWKADISKITSLGFTPKFGFDEGILNIANWIQTQ